MRIVVGQGSCGIAAGAEKVYSAIEKHLDDKSVLSITGCIGMCFLEPIVDIYDDENNIKYGIRALDELPLHEIGKINPALEKMLREQAFEKAKTGCGIFQRRLCQRTRGTCGCFFEDSLHPA